jgi:hypothetical protein
MIYALTDDDYKALSVVLIKTRNNIEPAINRLFNGYSWDFSDTLKLEKIGNMFRCNMCHYWKDNSELEGGYGFSCSSCVGSTENWGPID